MQCDDCKKLNDCIGSMNRELQEGLIQCLDYEPQEIPTHTSPTLLHMFHARNNGSDVLEAAKLKNEHIGDTAGKSTEARLFVQPGDGSP